MAKEAKVNYTEAQTESMKAEYAAGVSVEAIAEAMGKAVRSVRAKLVREGVYVAPEKGAKSKREEGPTKKEMLIQLADVWPDAPVDGLVNATKEAIASLVQHLESVAEIEESESDESEADAA
jgi:hypothetical protein